MYRRILVPLDGSDASLLGLKHAIGLAKDQHARLRILNVVDDLIMTPIMMEPMGAAEIPSLIEQLRAEGKKVLQKAAASAAKSGVKAQTVQIESGSRPVSDAIIADAKRARADIIVMGTHGRRGFNRLILGSDAERVLREATIPVLLTRTNEGRTSGARRKSGRSR